MKTWEYKIVSPNLLLGSDPFDDDEELSSQHLDSLGREGWELVCMIPKKEIFDDTETLKILSTPGIPFVFVFKRLVEK